MLPPTFDFEALMLIGAATEFCFPSVSLTPLPLPSPKPSHLALLIQKPLPTHLYSGTPPTLLQHLCLHWGLEVRTQNHSKPFFCNLLSRQPKKETKYSPPPFLFK